MEKKVRKINLKEFREFGFLQEVNRLFFHPLGMALEMIIEDNGLYKLGGIWDYRDDPEGCIFSEITDEEREKMKRVKEFIDNKHKERKERLGYIIQE
jgi:hypothetical protein